MATKKGTTTSSSPRKTSGKKTAGKSSMDAPVPADIQASIGNNGDLEDRIRQRAYELYEQRGRTDGLHHDDWVRAEREIRGEDTKRTA